MDHAMQAKGGMLVGGLAAQQAYASANATQPIQSMSEGILSRLNMIRSNFSQSRVDICTTADKIVGSAPTPIATGDVQIGKDRPPASCFLDQLAQVISDIEAIGAEVQEHLNRLHRAF